jgi:predicted amidophosphoribosyltransferase
MLKPCRHCGKPISRDANACPHCGVEMPGSSFGMRMFTALLAAVPSALVLYYVLHWSGLF